MAKEEVLQMNDRDDVSTNVAAKEDVHDVEEDDFDGTSGIDVHSTSLRDRDELLPLHKLLILASLQFAVQFVWALQNGNATAYFLEIGLDEEYVSVAWLAGPISGIISQLFIGAWSDRCEFPYGRRRIFISVGAAVLGVAALSFSHAKLLTVSFGEEWSSVVIVVAVSSFWVTDFALNAVQGPMRALLVDVVPPRQQNVANSIFALMNCTSIDYIGLALGNIVGYGLGAAPITLLPFVYYRVQGLYTIAVVLLLTVCVLLVANIQEKPFKNANGDETSLSEIFKGLYKAVLVFPSSMYSVIIVQCFTWYAWFTIFLYATAWVATEVYEGDAEAPAGTALAERYNRGIAVGNFGLCFQSIISMIFSMLIPVTVRLFSHKVTIGLGQAVQAICLLSTAFVGKGSSYDWMVVVLFGATGITWSICWSCPWTLCAIAITASTSSGTSMALLNLSTVLPEIVAAIASYFILFLFKYSLWVLFSGGVSAALGFAAVYLIDEEEILSHSVVVQTEVIAESRIEDCLDADDEEVSGCDGDSFSECDDGSGGGGGGGIGDAAVDLKEA